MLTLEGKILLKTAVGKSRMSWEWQRKEQVVKEWISFRKGQRLISTPPVYPKNVMYLIPMEL